MINSLLRKLNRRIFSSSKRVNIIQSLSDYDRSVLLFMLNFKFATYLSNNILRIKENYFIDNIIICDFKNKNINVSNYKKIKNTLDKKCPYNIIKRIRRSNKLIMLDLHYQYIIKIEQGSLEEWINSILKPTQGERYVGLYYFQLINMIKQNKELKKANEGLMKDLNEQIGKNIEYVNKLRNQEGYPSAPLLNIEHN